MDWPLTRYSIVAVVAIDAAEDAVPLARALLAGGVSTVEVTMRTPAALDAIAAIAADVPEIGIGAGTVLDPDHCAAAVDRGARFAVAPGLNPAVVEAAAAAGLPFAPGVATPSELDTAIRIAHVRVEERITYIMFYIPRGFLSTEILQPPHACPVVAAVVSV